MVVKSKEKFWVKGGDPHHGKIKTVICMQPMNWGFFDIQLLGLCSLHVSAYFMALLYYWNTCPLEIKLELVDYRAMHQIVNLYHKAAK